MSHEYRRRGKNWFTAMGVLFIVMALIVLIRNLLIWGPEFVHESPGIEFSRFTTKSLLVLSSETNLEMYSCGPIRDSKAAGWTGKFVDILTLASFGKFSLNCSRAGELLNAIYPILQPDIKCTFENPFSRITGEVPATLPMPTNFSSNTI